MKIRLKDAFDLQMGKTPARNTPAYWNGSYKWVSIADIGSAGKYITATKEGITDKAITESGIRAVPAHTVIMSFKLSIGKTAITSEKMYTNEAIMAFVDNGTYDIDTNYLYHLCCGTRWTEGTNKAVMGLTLNKATLSEKRISLPEITEQRNIAAKFDALDNVIEKTQAELSSLDQLVKSRFVEMFGEPSINSMGWAMKPFVETCILLTGNTPPRAVKGYYGSYIEWIKSDNITTSSLYLTKAAECLSEEGAKVGRVVHPGAILMTCIAGSLNTVGNVAIVDRDVAFNQQINALIPQQYETMFLYVLLQLLKPRLHEAASSALKCILNKGNLELFKAIVPSVELQKQFAAFVSEVDKSKLVVKQSLEKLETLKKSLMQQYFG